MERASVEGHFFCPYFIEGKAKTQEGMQGEPKSRGLGRIDTVESSDLRRAALEPKTATPRLMTEESRG